MAKKKVMRDATSAKKSELRKERAKERKRLGLVKKRPKKKEKTEPVVRSAVKPPEVEPKVIKKRRPDTFSQHPTKLHWVKDGKDFFAMSVIHPGIEGFEPMKKGFEKGKKELGLLLKKEMKIFLKKHENTGGLVHER